MDVSIPRDSSAGFPPRPWPRRASSPLAGRRIALVDPDRARREQLDAALRERGLRVVGAGEDPELVACADPGPVDSALATAWGGAILITAPGLCGELADRIWSHLPLPFDPSDLLEAFGRALEHQSLADENENLRAQLAGRLALGPFESRDPGTAEVLQAASQVADTHATVLLLGESGTGKSLLARAMHAASSRAAGPFIVVNCGALPGNLLESELFGHAKGAFTGAVADKLGRFEQASQGTLFLDEINSASPDLQTKLLRVLQERTFERVGESVSRTSEARVVAATNRDIPTEIAAGRFREDLYWRLNVVSLTVPPLRERPADLALLLDRFLDEFAAEYGRPRLEPSPETLYALAAYEWPGNVRQLRNAIHRAVLLASGPELNVAELPDEVRAHAGRTSANPAAGLPTMGPILGLAAGLAQLSEMPTLKDALAGPERAILVRALELAGGSRKDAAESLGINRSTLFNKMTKYGLMDLTFHPSEP